MYPVFWSVGNVNFYTHGLMIAIGSLLGGFVIYRLAKKENLPTNFLFDLLVFSLFSGIIGARIAYVILYNYQFQNWHDMFFVWYGGLVSFGGILFGFLFSGLILKRRKQNILRWFDIGIVGLLLGWSFGRVGCFLSGDVLGIKSLLKIAIWGRIPISLFEAIWSLILALVLLYFIVYRQNIISKFKPGFIFFAGIAGYAIGRFVIDFFREEPILYILKGGQIASLVVVLVIIIYFMLKYRVKSNNASKFENEGENAQKNY